MTYKLIVYDGTKPAAAVVEKYLPRGEIWQLRGFLFIPPELGATMGEPNDALLIGTSAFPAWTLPEK